MVPQDATCVIITVNGVLAMSVVTAVRGVIKVGGWILRTGQSVAPPLIRTIPPTVRATTKVVTVSARVATRAAIYGTREAVRGATGIGRNLPLTYGKSTLPERIVYSGIRRTLGAGRRALVFTSRAGLREAVRLTLTPYYAIEVAYGILRNPRLRRGAGSVVERWIDKRFINANRFLYDKGLQSTLIQTARRAAEYYALEKVFNHFSVTRDKVVDAATDVLQKAKKININPEPVSNEKPSIMAPAKQEATPPPQVVIRKPAPYNPPNSGVVKKRVVR